MAFTLRNGRVAAAAASSCSARMTLGVSRESSFGACHLRCDALFL